MDSFSHPVPLPTESLKLQRLQAEKNTLAKGLRELQRLGRSTLGEVVVFLVGVKIGQKTDFWMGFLQLHIFLRGHGTVLLKENLGQATCGL